MQSHFKLSSNLLLPLLMESKELEKAQPKSTTLKRRGTEVTEFES